MGVGREEGRRSHPGEDQVVAGHDDIHHVSVARLGITSPVRVEVDLIVASSGSEDRVPPPGFTSKGAPSQLFDLGYQRVYPGLWDIGKVTYEYILRIVLVAPADGIIDWE